jgi:uncharacterized glyoxalase superfamily metalloenzyme YdcJ
MGNTRQPSTGGLHLPTNVGIGQTEQQKTHHIWDTSGEVIERLKAEGFWTMDTPNYELPQITVETLTTADNTHYTTVYAQQLAWFNYATQILAKAKVEVLQTKNEMDLIESRMRKGFRDTAKANSIKPPSEQTIQDEINLDARYSELKLYGQKMEQYKIMLDTFAEGIERGLKVISRQVEIRKMEMEQTNVNIPGRDNSRSVRRP